MMLRECRMANTEDAWTKEEEEIACPLWCTTLVSLNAVPLRDFLADNALIYNGFLDRW
jgi:hypothetical protein